MSLRIVLIGSVAFSRSCLVHLIEINAKISGVVTLPDSNFNSDFADLEKISVQAEIPCFKTKSINDKNTLAWIRRLEPDIIFCFGWSQIIRAELLNLAPLGVVGYHPALLPKNRGRHPLIWALALGLTKTGSSFFFMDKGVDSGDILSQSEIDISSKDDANDLYKKITDTALAQISDFLPRLEEGSNQRLPQDHTQANIWRKRFAADGRIDWRMSTSSIHNLVRALTRPYPGATFLLNNQEITLWKSRPANLSENLVNLEPGRILKSSKNLATVKTGDGAIDLLEYELETPLEPGKYL